MSKMKEKTEEQMPMKAEQEVMTHTALGVYKATNGEWMVAVVGFNPITGSTEMQEPISTGGYRDMAIEKFKIEAGAMLYRDTV